MATSPPLEEKVNLYLIVTLPFRPGSFHHFFIYSAADSEMQKSLKLYLITSYFVTSSAKYGHTRNSVHVPALKEDVHEGISINVIYAAEE